jgi:hypothetical protein
MRPWWPSHIDPVVIAVTCCHLLPLPLVRMGLYYGRKKRAGRCRQCEVAPDTTLLALPALMEALLRLTSQSARAPVTELEGQAGVTNAMPRQPAVTFGEVTTIEVT